MTEFKSEAMKVPLHETVERLGSTPLNEMVSTTTDLIGIDRWFVDGDTVAGYEQIREWAKSNLDASEFDAFMGLEPIEVIGGYPFINPVTKGKGVWMPEDLYDILRGRGAYHHHIVRFFRHPEDRHRLVWENNSTVLEPKDNPYPATIFDLSIMFAMNQYHDKLPAEAKMIEFAHIIRTRYYDDFLGPNQFGGFSRNLTSVQLDKAYREFNENNFGFPVEHRLLWILLCTWNRDSDGVRLDPLRILKDKVTAGEAYEFLELRTFNLNIIVTIINQGIEPRDVLPYLRRGITDVRLITKALENDIDPEMLLVLD